MDLLLELLLLLLLHVFHHVRKWGGAKRNPIYLHNEYIQQQQKQQHQQQLQQQHQQQLQQQQLQQQIHGSNLHMNYIFYRDVKSTKEAEEREK